MGVNPPWGANKIFFKNPLGTFFSIIKIQLCAKNHQKSDARFSRYRVTNERTDERESFGESPFGKIPPSLGDCLASYTKVALVRDIYFWWIYMAYFFPVQTYFSTKHSTKMKKLHQIIAEYINYQKLRTFLISDTGRVRN